MDLHLDDDQADLLRDLLVSDLRELRGEIHDTDSPRFKAGLKEREATLRAILDKLGRPLPHA